MLCGAELLRCGPCCCRTRLSQGGRALAALTGRSNCSQRSWSAEVRARSLRCQVSLAVIALAALASLRLQLSGGVALEPAADPGMLSSQPFLRQAVCVQVDCAAASTGELLQGVDEAEPLFSLHPNRLGSCGQWQTPANPLRLLHLSANQSCSAGWCSGGSEARATACRTYDRSKALAGGVPWGLFGKQVLPGLLSRPAREAAGCATAASRSATLQGQCAGTQGPEPHRGFQDPADQQHAAAAAAMRQGAWGPERCSVLQDPAEQQPDREAAHGRSAAGTDALSARAVPAGHVHMSVALNAGYAGGLGVLSTSAAASSAYAAAGMGRDCADRFQSEGIAAHADSSSSRLELSEEVELDGAHVVVHTTDPAHHTGIGPAIPRTRPVGRSRSLAQAPEAVERLAVAWRRIASTHDLAKLLAEGEPTTLTPQLANPAALSAPRCESGAADAAACCCDSKGMEARSVRLRGGDISPLAFTLEAGALKGGGGRLYVRDWRLLAAGLLLMGGAAATAAFMFAWMIGARLMPPARISEANGHGHDRSLVSWWAWAAQDQYYCVLVPLTLPVFLAAVFWNWLSWKLFKHNP